MAAPLPNSGSHLACLGVGEGWPSGSRRHACFVYQLGSTRILLDCGDGMSTGFKAGGFDYHALDAVILSHMHSDHVGGFSMFVQSLWLAERRRPLAIYAPAQGIPALQAWLNATVLPRELLGFELQWHPLASSQPFEVGEVRITPHATTHLQSLQRSFGARYPDTSFEAFSFTLEHDGLRLGHTADIGAVQDLLPLLEHPLSLLVCELSHIEVPDLTALLRRSPPGRVVFVHVARELLADATALEARLRTELNGIPFVLAHDDDLVAL